MRTRPATRSGRFRASQVSVWAPIDAPARTARSRAGVIEHGLQVGAQVLVAVGVRALGRRGRAVTAGVIGDARDARCAPAPMSP